MSTLIFVVVYVCCNLQAFYFIYFVYCGFYFLCVLLYVCSMPCVVCFLCVLCHVFSMPCVFYCMRGLFHVCSVPCVSVERGGACQEDPRSVCVQGERWPRGEARSLGGGRQERQRLCHQRPGYVSPSGK